MYVNMFSFFSYTSDFSSVLYCFNFLNTIYRYSLLLSRYLDPGTFSRCLATDQGHFSLLLLRHQLIFLVTNLNPLIWLYATER
jgi:hypothetical protein